MVPNGAACVVLFVALAALSADGTSLPASKQFGRSASIAAVSEFVDVPIDSLTVGMTTDFMVRVPICPHLYGCFNNA